MTFNNRKIDLVNMNAYIKCGEIMSICSHDIERKRNWALIKGHDSGTNFGKMACNNPKLDHINTQTKLG